MGLAKLKIDFLECGEMRMGSPDRCKLHIEGDWIPDLEEWSWYRHHEISYDQRYHALAKWNLMDNHPGFNIVILDTETRTIQISERISGICRAIKKGPLKFAWEVFQTEAAVNFSSYTKD